MKSDRKPPGPERPRAPRGDGIVRVRRETQGRGEKTVTTISGIPRPGDELAMHLHAWKSLATAASIEPKLSPSFLTGTDKLLEFEDGDVGFDTDLDAYTGPELRALLRTSRKLLEQTKLPISKSFRAGGYGAQDIWASTRKSVDSAWSTPVNVGGGVNTAAAETRPSLSKNARQLLFGRAPGPEGMSDVYVSTRTQK